MKYCHSCRYEFRDEIEECPDCGVPLKDTPPVSDEYKEVEWVVLRQLPNPVYAEMVKEVLDNAEIPNYLSFDFMSSAFILRGVSLVGESGKLFVPKDFKAEAEELVEPLVDAEGDDPEEDTA